MFPLVSTIRHYRCNLLLVVECHMDTVTSLFQRLQSEEDRLPALLDGKTHLVNLNPDTLRGIIKVQDLTVLFLCLDTTNEEQIAAVLFILKLLLPIFDVGAKFEALSQHLWTGLSHKNHDVRELCLTEFEKCCVTEVGNSAMIESKNVVAKIIELIGDKEMSIALAAANVLAEFGSNSLNAAKVLLQPGDLLENLKNVMKVDDNVRYRVYDVIVKIQAKSLEYLAVCDESNLLKNMVAELMGDDVLIRVVCIATLSEMALKKHSLEYLKRNGVLDRLVFMITNAASDPLANLYMPEVVKFFGKMCHQEGPQNVLGIFPQFLSTIFGFIAGQDPAKKKIGIETLGFIGRSLEGKNVLAKEEGRTMSAMREIGNIICGEGSDLKLIAINAMCQLLHIEPANQSEDVVNLTLKWFQCISSSPVDAILSLCKQPFTNVRCAGFAIVETLAKLEWGMSALVEFPTFVEFVLDRTVDQNKESKDARFEAVKAIAESPRCMHIFGNNNYLKFRAFVQEGPVYQESHGPEVAMETS